MKKSNASLYSARLRKSWTREFVSQKVGVSLNTYIRWETGLQTPRTASLQALCEIFAMSPEELGFDENPDARPDGTLEKVGPGHSPLPLPPQPRAEMNRISDTLVSWAESMEVCWKVYMQGGHEEIEKQLPDYFRNLKGPALFPGPSQVRAAHILSEAHQLHALLKLHRADFIAAQTGCAQAIIHSQLANDWNIYIAAQLRMATILNYHKQPTAALNAYQEALRRINGTHQYISPLLHSWTFAGIGLMYAALGGEKDAMQYLQLAMATFPEQPEEDLAYNYTRMDYSQLMLYEGLILLRLGQPQFAWNAFAQIDEFRPAIPRRLRTEVLYQKACTALALGHMVQCCVYLEAAVKAAREIKSIYFLNESFALYEQLLSFWGQESRVRVLAKLFP
ncbi:MAG TPA: helix-turn-helix domain-containing protein [Ktedonobacteraceae bacterium]|jgi:tetratricopeptide (TPR) repeat protein|nr:helix-turn-helix domain-containing protein [Ktedonobacteraceae bacterium]